ncbi:MAG: phenylalanine--tRNA ligase subunit beta, partial [Fervidobacterium sp.]
EFDTMRPSILYGLLESLSYNYKRQLKDVKLFEIGKVFSIKDEKPFEEEALAFVATGRESVNDYTDKRLTSFYTFKGVLEELFERLGIKVRYEKSKIEGFVPTRFAVLRLSGDSEQKIGIIGMVEPEVADKLFDVKDELYLAEIYIERLYNLGTKSSKYKLLPQFPYIRRDVSYLIPIGFEISGLITIYENNPLVEEVGIDDIYREVGEGFYSVTIYAKFRHPERTLNDEEVDLTLEDIKKQINEKFGISPRF